MNGRAVARYVVLLNGVVNTLTGLAILAAPHWFYRSIADFPPFNRHFLGDAGALTLAIGIGLMIAARDLAAHRTVVGVGVLGSLAHVLNHLYDDVLVERGATTHWLSSTLPLLALALTLAWAWWQSGKEDRHPKSVRALPSATSVRG